MIKLETALKLIQVADPAYDEVIEETLKRLEILEEIASRAVGWANSRKSENAYPSCWPDEIIRLSKELE